MVFTLQKPHFRKVERNWFEGFQLCGEENLSEPWFVSQGLVPVWRVSSRE